MQDAMKSIRDTVAWLARSPGDRLAEFSQDREGYRARVENAKLWLCTHPQETIEVLQNVRLSKYDRDLADLLGRIGSPTADACAAELASLLVDLNWPAYSMARSALFGRFNKRAIVAAAEQFARGAWPEFDALLWEINSQRRDWLGEMKPIIRHAVQLIEVESGGWEDQAYVDRWRLWT
jgi:hypothetical protein